MTKYETILMEAGVGVFPYIAVDRSGVPLLFLAITLPSIEREDLHELTLVADDVSKLVPITPQTRSIMNHWMDSRTLSFDLAGGDVSHEFLESLALARKRFMIFGENGKRRVKVSADNARSIGEMLRLYEAMRQELRLENKDPITGLPK